MTPWLVVLAACGWSDYRGATPATVKNDGVAMLVGAAARHDARAIAQLLHPQLEVGGIWFEDAACRGQFATPGAVVRAGFEPLAACLAALPLKESDRTSAISGVAVLTYAPGLELEARFVTDRTGPKLRWIGYVARTSLADGLPTITQRALELLRTGEANVVDDNARAALDGELAAEKGTLAWAWVKLCIDGTGAVTGVHPRAVMTDMSKAVFIGLAKKWTFRPFVLGGQPAPVCAMTSLTYPAHEPLQQLPGATSYTDRPHISPRMLEPQRIAGDKLIVPDDTVKTLIHESKSREVRGMYILCADATGVVDVVDIITSSGYPRYDAHILRSMKTWRYKPYLVDGKPSGVCSLVTFIYSQR